MELTSDKHADIVPAKKIVWLCEREYINTIENIRNIVRTNIEGGSILNDRKRHLQ